MPKRTILFLFVVSIALCKFEVPSKHAKATFINVKRVGDKIATATVVGFIECIEGEIVECKEGEFSIYGCDMGPASISVSGTKRRDYPCDVEDCECGVSIPSDGIFFYNLYDTSCGGYVDIHRFVSLDTCILSNDLYYRYTVSNKTLTYSYYETETCEGTPHSKSERPIEECKSGKYTLPTKNLGEYFTIHPKSDEHNIPDEPNSPEGSVATWVASVTFIMISIFASA